MALGTQETGIVKKGSDTKQNSLSSQDSSKNLPAISEEMYGAWGAEEATSSDIIIPKLLLMHGQSEKVLEGERGQGELVLSHSWEVVAKRGESVRVVPFKMMKTWRISEIVGGVAQWRREEPWTTENDSLPWDFEEIDPNGSAPKKMRRDQAYNFYVLLADRLHDSFPIKLQFTRTSRKAGTVLAGHFAECKMRENQAKFDKTIKPLPPAARTFKIGSDFINGEKQKYFVFTAELGEASTNEQIAAAYTWWKTIEKSGRKVQEVEVDDIVTTAVIDEDNAKF